MFNYPINVTIDTNIFESCKYDLSNNSTLRVLTNHVNDGKVKIFLSDIVLREAKAHIKKQSAALYSLIRKNRSEILKVADENLIDFTGLKEYISIPDKEKIKEKACARFDEYIKSLNPYIFDNSLIDVDGIIDDYFEFNAPFEHSEKKRKEFPDAFIANQIREEFPQKDAVIISSDYIFFNSLGDLYNKISEQDKDYHLTISILEELYEDINVAIIDNVEKYGYITVYGQSKDRKGVVISGYDYSETMLNKIENVSHCIHIIDDIKDNTAIITLKCNAEIKMDCYFEDYDNAPWDSERKEYVYVDIKHIIEKHKARFGVRLCVNLCDKNFELNDVVIFLGGDTIEDRYTVDDEIEKLDWGEEYNICPDCGCSISHKNDGGNGFCINCAPNH